MSYRCKYEYQRKHGDPLHMWSAVGAKCGIHLWIQERSPLYVEAGCRGYSGGLEMHYSQPPKYRAGDAPDHDRCWLLDGPCYHDGTSLIDRWIELWRVSHDHERIFTELKEVLDEEHAKEKEVMP